MNCPLCGEVCRCPLEPLPSALQGRDDLESAGSSLVAASSLPADAVVQAADEPAWRDELSDRLNRYRARRKVRPPRYPSLSLKFDAPAASTPGGPSVPEFEPISSHALALDGMRHAPSAAVEPNLQSRQAPVVETAAASVVTSACQPGVHASAKIIEFPRFAWAPPPPPPDQLAEPVGGDRPRILEVPEAAPPPPALGGISIEAAEQGEAEKRLGIDIPLQSAPLGLRCVASLVDGLIIAAASALFGYIFWKVAGVRPPLVQTLGIAAGISCLFWAAYQYLMIVYAASTLGLRAAGLELARFDGSSTNRTLRRWRVLAACLSAVSAGMGYIWVFLDEDALCWHDRITHTYLAPGKAKAEP
jgi:uncharacterized RDD family membrane protein YckC